jgi:hypothetical protein
MHKLKVMMEIYLHVDRKDIHHVLHAFIHGLGLLPHGLEGTPLRCHEDGICPRPLGLLAMQG